MSTPESRAREAYDEAQRSKISGPSLVKPDGIARESQGEVDQLRTELARADARVRWLEQERDRLRRENEELRKLIHPDLLYEYKEELERK
jgi:predicted  nucleic acid-binding Zn-ribbon protein